ncbi:biotin--[acetyl-CoA-carboxylase] ligase [Virgibacillus sp. LDC1]|uniref:biotin--[acetyl-CoA-carboxylase] ligase n=1 Tax=Paenibacillus sp. GM2FR TaxID=2059268 RepID=UPI000C2723A8|nr:biotin--[acetyl-CoA-carboxylase] ligase [Paenibacillus sp. GM2FR]MCV4230228.1 biotin--[acetyl-CoA-carboxylase] ligase [Virgibacillus sp. LDC1]PJN54032.1 Bifunctional ligase/repressor BirA [Paenibacillus sp. GM2FR]
MKDYDQDNALLKMFQEHSGQFLSGEEISRKLSISRTAVWKQINKLRHLGYDFEAVPRLGYRMMDEPDKLSVEQLTAGMTSQTFGKPLKLLDKTTSTQEDARQLAEEGAAEGTLVISEEQTGGRGRMGRKFHSPRGKGIWMSLVLRPKQPLHLTQQLTLLTGVAVCRAITKCAGVQTDIKWPNDILFQGKKVCGILLESATEDERVRYCIAGIGISANLKESDFPEELRSVATSIRMAGGATVNRTELIQAIMAEMEVLYELYNEQGFEPIASLWEALSGTVGREVQVQTARDRFSGIATGLNRDGALLVRNQDDELIPVYSGDILFNTR